MDIRLRPTPKRFIRPKDMTRPKGAARATRKAARSLRKKEQQHQYGQTAAQKHHFGQLPQGSGHQGGLILHRLQLEALGQNQPLHGLAYIPGDLQGIGPLSPQHRHQNRLPAVHPRKTR